MTMTPSSQTVNYGAKATVTALVSSGAKNAYPTGTVTFYDGGQTVGGPTTCTSTTDSSGNYACQAAASFTVSDSYGVNANYSGDSNYPASSGYASIAMPDFSLNPNQYQVTVTAGQSQNLTISLGSISGFTGSISNFSCSGLPAEANCSFNPTQVTANANQSVTTTLTISTAAIGQASRAHRASNTRPGLFPLAGLFLTGVCLIGFSGRRKHGVPLLIMLLAFTMMLPSCGGGGNSGGGGGNNNPVPSITTISPSKIAAGSQISSITVDGTNFMNTSTVTLGGASVQVGYQSATELFIYPPLNELQVVNQLPVVVTNPAPGGGASNAVALDVTTGTPTGNFNITVTATSGGLTHSTQLNLIVQ
jgi:hypothetical protein